MIEKGDCGAPGGIRTPDLLVRSQTLYPAELRAHSFVIVAQAIIFSANRDARAAPKFPQGFPRSVNFLQAHPGKPHGVRTFPLARVSRWMDLL